MCQKGNQTILRECYEAIKKATGKKALRQHEIRAYMRIHDWKCVKVTEQREPLDKILEAVLK